MRLPIQTSTVFHGLALLLGSFVAGNLAPPDLIGDEYQFSLRSGSVLTVETDGPAIEWTDVLPNGQMRKRDIELDQVQRLVLSNSPASKQVAEIRKFLNMLQSDNYLEREQAEAQLSDPKVGGRFLTLIKTEKEHPRLEVRYRVARVLDRLAESEEESISEFDTLLLKDGTQLEGDAGEFTFDVVYRGQSLSLSREDIRLIGGPGATPSPNRPPMTPVRVLVSQDYQDGFYQPGQTTIDFETAPGGSELKRNTDVSDVFIPQGLILGTEKVGFVGISGYGFKYKPMPPAGNSICVFETVGSYSKRFKGVLEMRFCMPDQRSVVAGVNELGLFIARVDERRDFIVEAYNADGQVLACVEASGSGCVFAGIKSPEPITFVRILSNPYLYRITRKIDEDFAVDHVCFSPPVPVVSARESEQGLIRLKNGDVLKGKTIRPENGSVSIDVKPLNQSLTLPMKDVQTIRFNTDPVQIGAGTREWMAMLEDRSVLRVEPGQQFQSQMFEGLSYTPDQVAGLWFARDKVRFPIAGDLESGNHVMVYPTCRLVAEDVEFRADGYSWQAAEKLEQVDVDHADGQEEKEDPTPDVSEIRFDDSPPEDIPTFWNRLPQTQARGTGTLRLVDGQQLVLGGSVGFNIKRINQDAVTISVGGIEQTIPLSQVLSIDFPATEAGEE